MCSISKVTGEGTTQYMVTKEAETERAVGVYMRMRAHP